MKRGCKALAARVYSKSLLLFDSSSNIVLSSGMDDVISSRTSLCKLETHSWKKGSSILQVYNIFAEGELIRIFKNMYINRVRMQIFLHFGKWLQSGTCHQARVMQVMAVFQLCREPGTENSNAVNCPRTNPRCLHGLHKTDDRAPPHPLHRLHLVSRQLWLEKEGQRKLGVYVGRLRILPSLQYLKISTLKVAKKL